MRNPDSRASRASSSALLPIHAFVSAVATMYSPLDPDPEWGGAAPMKEPTYEFAEATVRHGFVRKVLGLLTTQLLVTAAVSWTFVAVPEVKGFVGAHPWVLWTSMGLAFALILVLACSESARRSHPTNLILLMLFTGFEAVLVGSACAVYDAQVVLLALAITGAVVLGLVLFTLQTHVDLTSIGGVLYSLLWTLLVAGIVQAFVHAPWLHIAICAGGAALFSCYLIFDLQMVMGNGELALSPDEYILATLNLYLDIINMFLYILQLVNEFNKDR